MAPGEGIAAILDLIHSMTSPRKIETSVAMRFYSDYNEFIKENATLVSPASKLIALLLYMKGCLKVFNNGSDIKDKGIIEHLEDFRKHLLISIAAIVSGAIIGFSHSEKLISILILPLNSLNQKLIVTGVTEAFYVKLKVSLIAGVILAFPVIVIAFWRFFKPALRPRERKYIYWLFPISIILFAGGILFAYYIILPLLLSFFIYTAGNNLSTMIKVDEYFSFLCSFVLPFGLIFELPVIVFFLTAIGIVNHKMLAKNRKYALLIIVILAAALTPGPDPISQLSMAAPVYLLYEISILVARFSGLGKSGKLETGTKEGDASSISKIVTIK
ncbi:MAG: twin-arginine translocase subunit TatC [Syntrophomonas sp.]